ncbi:chemotaxis protein CheV [Methylophaga sp. OBS4]|uniref:chemotaxis protein CheV n=1 Tax=Methylophaga sp. OBS4 TaxID=2991935 RepID=UPI00225B04F3|nr:chemotaxis protein CheV [Methylophaga sp. OBS4]MCX4187474.1 chemotaxis protein CheV [Methylophaga sp. OBS4]
MSSSIIDGVDQRTQLAGNNRLELLLFRLGGQQLYGINVFKVREAIPCPALTQMPHAHPVIRGVASVRGQAVSFFDLSKGIGRRGVDNTENSFVILTEYNRSVQGFLVSGVDRIINISWSEVLPPPPASGTRNYMTAITKVDDQIVQIIDVEQVLAEVLGISSEVSSELVSDFSDQNQERRKHILVADDSNVARNQIKRTLEQIGLETTVTRDGKEALQQLKTWAAEGIDVAEHVALLISDIEMPEMDGYTLTAEIRKDPQLKHLRVLLHTSMSGTFNSSLVEKVGADRFLPKFSADELATEVQAMIAD